MQYSFLIIFLVAGKYGRDFNLGVRDTNASKESTERLKRTKKERRRFWQKELKKMKITDIQQTSTN
jgi:hypothetical protein